MLDGTPQIMLADRWIGGSEAVDVGPTLAWAKRPWSAATSAAAAYVAEEWTVAMLFPRGARTHRLRLRQSGGELAGERASDGFAGTVSGRVEADQVRLRLAMAAEGTAIIYSLEGQASDDKVQRDYH